MRYLALLLAVALCGCATPAREARRVVSIKPDTATVATSVADTRKSVTSASTRVGEARKATEEAILAASKNDVAFLSQKLAYVSLTLQTTQEDLTEALSQVSKSETAITELNARIEQQTLELTKLNEDYNTVAMEKRQAEVSLAGAKTRIGILWRFLIGVSILAAIEGVLLYFAFKKPF